MPRVSFSAPAVFVLHENVHFFQIRLGKRANFEHMPELEWRLGYPLALAGMLAVALILYGVFRRKRWI